jgi:hypothetical protein
MVCNTSIVTIVTKAMRIKAEGLGTFATRLITGVIAMRVGAYSVLALHKPIAN